MTLRLQEETMEGTATAVLVQAGDTVPSFIMDGVKDRDSQIPDRFKGVYREDNGDLVTIVSSAYKLVNHKELLAQLPGVIEEAGLEVEKLSVTFTGKQKVMDYGKMFIKVQCSEEELLPADLYKVGFIVRNSIDGSMGFAMECMLYRMICSNGAFIGSVIEGHKHRHIGNLDTSGITDWLRGFGETVERIKTTLQSASERVLTEKEVEAYLGELRVPVPVLRAIRERAYTLQEGRLKTQYDLWNDATYVLSHLTTADGEAKEFTAPREYELLRQPERILLGANTAIVAAP